MEQRKFNNAVLDEIKKSCDRMKTESDGRKPEEPLSFGIRYLDECLGGIWKNDLIVLGAKSGIGKTEAAKICALANAQSKRVHFFALEAEEAEIERRLKYTLLSTAVYGSMRDSFRGIRFNYMDWMLGRFNSILGDHEKELDKIIAESFPNLFTYYQKTTKLTEENIEQVILSIQDQTDLIIIDHLHFFDFEDENENRAMKKLMKALKRLSESCSKPILLLAHLRKSDKRFKSMVPDMEDFHGSSDISKIATKVILLAPAKQDGNGSFVYPTYIQAAKNRYDNSRTRFVGVCGYDTRRNCYEEKYNIGRISFDGQEFEKAIEAPYWAKSAVEHPSQRISPVEAKKRLGFPGQRSGFDD